jgi:hypothetical protein
VEIRTTVIPIDIRRRKFAVVLIDQSIFLINWCWLGWRVILWSNSSLRLKVTQIELFFVLILDHAVESHKLVVKGHQLFWSLAVIESGNTSDS